MCTRAMSFCNKDASYLKNIGKLSITDTSHSGCVKNIMVVLSVRPASEPRRMLWAPSRTLTWDTEPHDPQHLSGATVHTVGRSQDPLLGYEAPSAEVLEVEGASGSPSRPQRVRPSMGRSGRWPPPRPLSAGPAPAAHTGRTRRAGSPA